MSDTPAASPATPPADSKAAPEVVPRSDFEELRSAHRLQAGELQARTTALEAAAARVQELEGLLSERDTTLRRQSVRIDTGVDDDSIADMVHARHAAAMEGVEEGKRQPLGEWWKGIAADQAARSALPKALQVYLPEQKQEQKPPAGPRGAPSPRRTDAGVDSSPSQLTGAARTNFLRDFLGQRRV